MDEIGEMGGWMDGWDYMDEIGEMGGWMDG
jgi:hypothetical protein